MKVDSWQCDVCGKMREKDTNRWWLVSGGAPPEGFLCVATFDRTQAGDKHVCGEDCAIQLVQRWMATGSFDKPRAVSA